MNTFYYIVELQNRADGLTNSTITQRSSLANALSYYYERKSKLIPNTEFVSAVLMLIDNEGNTIEEAELIETQYKAE